MRSGKRYDSFSEIPPGWSWTVRIAKRRYREEKKKKKNVSVIAPSLRQRHPMFQLTTAAFAITSDFVRTGPSPDLGFEHPRLVRSPHLAADAVEQLHVNAGATPDSVIVTWATAAVTGPSRVTATTASGTAITNTAGLGESYSMLLDPSPYYPSGLNKTCLGSKNYTDVVDCYYTSPVIHSVTLTGLAPDTAYTIGIDGLLSPSVFTTAPAVGDAITFGVVGDLGQTGNSSATVDALAAMLTSGTRFSMMLHAGDLAYADGNGPRWDSYARMGEHLWSKVPTAYVGGNHEVASGGENWMSYKVRYPNQHETSNSASFLYHSLDAGMAHVVCLCSYLDFLPGSLQYTWLMQDLAAVDRTKTPWVIAMFHTPWYTSNAHHPMSEGTAMRDAMEPLFHEHGVDIVFNGHVHAYERTQAVYKETLDSTGTTHITIGDGGNRELYATPWLPTQPSWSAFREFAYGFGLLTLENATTAQWRWVRSSNTSADPRDHDSATITRTARQ